MRILAVCPVPPTPTSGAGTREFHLLRHLAQSHEVHVVATSSGEDEAADQLRPYVSSVRLVRTRRWSPPASAQGRWRNRLTVWIQTIFGRDPRYVSVYPVQRMMEAASSLHGAHRCEIVHCAGLYAAPVRRVVSDIPSIITAMDVESSKLERLVLTEPRSLRRVQLRIELAKLRRYERRALGVFSAVIAVSELDRGRILQLVPGAHVDVVPNGVDVGHFAPPANAERSTRRVVFVGNLGYHANVDALEILVRAIWPVVREANHEAELLIVGPNGTDEIEALTDLARGVSVMGMVPDIRPVLWDAALSVVPLRSGGGTRLKIVEALAAGCPVISSSVGAEGLDLVHGEHLLVCEHPDDFATAVLRLLSAPSVAATLAERGRRVVAERYDWRQLSGLHERVLLETWESTRLARSAP